jgi:hypothetical protein
MSKIATVSTRDFCDSEATLVFSMVGNVDLSEIQGCEAIHHDSNSSIGLDTLYHSQWRIPETFLRGGGDQDSMIEYIRTCGRESTNEEEWTKLTLVTTHLPLSLGQARSLHIGGFSEKAQRRVQRVPVLAPSAVCCASSS